MADTTIVDPVVPVPDYTTSTNLGQLPPTTFPPDCLNSLFDLNTIALGLPWTYNTQGCAVSTCCPSSNFYTENFAWMTSYYSPGVCPGQYRRCAPPASLSSEPGETIALCCPTNYQCPQVGPNSATYDVPCLSLLSTTTQVVVLDNIFNQEVLSTRTFTLDPGFLNSWQLAYPIQVRSRTGDTFTSDSQPTETSPGRQDSPEDAGGGSSLSTGAIVGIVFGVLFFFALVAAAVLTFILLRRRRNSANTQAPVPPGPGYPNQPPGYPNQQPWQPQMGTIPVGPAAVKGPYEMDPTVHPPGPNRPELDPATRVDPTTQVYEMDPAVQAYELGSGVPPVQAQSH
ncbi:uncharacterized protein DNG_09621 [Cephalotrichum gorgonifer]|uniref:Uncharacterized protein n=1 Tax=Cephalotrichum gorgonifer TaxID=2041049 RepID=A0AAE8N8G0_9PEZI|nr:uncharacterized protein DNG_09621 [Cephalotrichum gorgonifer]